MKSFTPRHVLALAAIIAAGVVLQPVAAVAAGSLVTLVDSSTNTPAKIDATGALLTTTNATVRTTPADAPVRITELQLRGGGPAATVTRLLPQGPGRRVDELCGYRPRVKRGALDRRRRLRGAWGVSSRYVHVRQLLRGGGDELRPDCRGVVNAAAEHVFDNLLPSLVFKPQNTTATTGAASVGVRVIVYGIK